MGSTDYKPLEIDYWSNLTTMILDMVELENSNLRYYNILPSP